MLWPKSLCQAQKKVNFPLVGNTSPDFEAEAVFAQEFIKVTLSEYIGKKYVVLFFYPLDFTFVCPTEITAFGDLHADFEELNTEILGVSVDSVALLYEQENPDEVCPAGWKPGEKSMKPDPKLSKVYFAAV